MGTYVIKVTDFKFGLGNNLRGCLVASLVIFVLDDQGPNSIALKIDRKTDRKSVRDLFPLLRRVFDRIFNQF